MRVRAAFVVTLAAAVFGVAGAQAGVGNMTNHGGPVLRSPKVYVVVWLPAGRHIEPSGDDSRVEARLKDTVESLSGTPYLGVLTQYGATDRVRFGGMWIDRSPYPHAGTTKDPLELSDYAGAAKRALAKKGWTPGLGKLYLVFTADRTEMCGLSTAPSGGRDPTHFYTPNDCTFPDSEGDQCAGHGSFRQQGKPVAFAAVPYPAASACIATSNDPNNDVRLDTLLTDEAMFVAAMIVDPLGNGWFTGNAQTGEIACFSGEYDSVLRLGGKPVPVFELWSNAKHGCVTR